MSFEEFLAAAAPPAGMSPALQALWHMARGEKTDGWERAHACAQADGSREGAWVHAHLHRVEGDDANAGYWYARAGRKPPAKTVTFEAEREAITRALLAEAE
jgi:hypothetical protein